MSLEDAFKEAANKAWNRVVYPEWKRSQEKGVREVPPEAEKAIARAERMRRQAGIDIAQKRSEIELFQRDMWERTNHKTHVKLESPLRCPECGDVDHHNRMNGKPWCMKCNCVLVPEGEKRMKIRFPREQKSEITFNER